MLNVKVELPEFCTAKIMTAIIWGDTKGWIDPKFQTKQSQTSEAEGRRLQWEREKNQLFLNLNKYGKN